MALSGACPGTVLAQVALGIRSGFYALDGSVLGGIAYIGYFGPLINGLAAKQSEASPPKDSASVHEKLGISRHITAFGFITASAAVIVATSVYTPASPYAKLAPALGGLLIGLAQLVSILTRGAVIGTSTTYEEIGKYFWWLLKGADTAKVPRSYNNLLYSAGLLAGSYGMAKAVPSLVADTPLPISPASVTIGGFLMVVGSRAAGGCTSGHGISGISLLSISSFVTIFATFVGGMLTAPFV
jgi:uncharacterized membrane protein YedE/YeeE